MILLTNEERKKFAAWLRQDAAADTMMLNQFQRPELKIPVQLIDSRGIEREAKLVIAGLLESIEDA